MKRLFLALSLIFAGAVGASAQMVQAVSYNFSTVENPLSDGGNFTTIADTNFIGVLKAIAGNLCEEATANKNAGSFYSAAIAAPSGTWPADQYSEMTLTTYGVAGTAGYLFLRQGSAASGNQYVVSIAAGTTYTFFAFVGGTAHQLATGSQTSAQGDVFRFGVVGNVLTLYRNGSSVQTFTDTNNYVTAGSPGLGMISPAGGAGIAAMQTALWAAGANQSATPTFSPVAGSYTGTQTVTITSTFGRDNLLHARRHDADALVLLDRQWFNNFRKHNANRKSDYVRSEQSR